ncbi:MAG TPA: hypothetical protein PLS10_13450 [Chitinophagales bacterium]|jgi:hypothetical protein|nr:hypothetical protein [Chitinophagales bacterium]
MTLQEKILNKFPFTNKEYIKEYEQIADDFAIGFAEWIWGNCFNIYNDRFLYKDDEYKTKELLEIYKKEKGL